MSVQSIVMILTGGKARVAHLLSLLLGMKNALGYSWLCIRTLSRHCGPESSPEAKMGKNSVFVHVLGIQMVRSCRKARREQRPYTEK
jgi:hypothetical protein